MTHLPKLRINSILRWGSSNFPSNLLRLQEHPISRNNFPFSCSYNNVDPIYKYFSTMSNYIDQKVDVEGSLVTRNGYKVKKAPPNSRKEVQDALLQYFHCTRNLPFMDAENLSKNSPKFVKKLMKNINWEKDRRRSVTRFLCYNPINEFEPFFESIGLDPSKFVSRDSSLYLSDEEGLLDNYRVLCQYGIAPNSLGKIYRVAREVFQYGEGVLVSKLRGFEKMGFSSSVIIKAVSFNPYLLIDDKCYEFFKVASKLQCLGCGFDWIEEHLVNAYYDWRQIFEVLVMLDEMGCKGAELGKLLREHPELLTDCSGQSTFSLVGFLLKLGSTKNDICSMFLNFPKVEVRKFVGNLRRAFKLQSELQRNGGGDIGRVFRTHFMMFGSSSLIKVRCILASLDIGRARLDVNSPSRKIEFLSSIGFAKNSQMERALKKFRGKGDELQERFDCLVQSGLSEEDVAAMVKQVPHILNQSKEVLETKIRFLVNDLGYPLSSLKPFPYCLTYSMERVTLRCLMCDWLVNKGVVMSKLTLRYKLKTEESTFVEKVVNKHPQGPDVWQELKNNISAGVKVKSMLASLDIGGTHCCEHIVANPLEPKKQVLRTKVERLPELKKQVLRTKAERLSEQKKRVLRTKELPEPKKRILRTKAERLPEQKKRVLRTKAERLPEPKKRVLRTKAEQLPEPKKQVSQTKAERLPWGKVHFQSEKIKFLSSIGFAENSKDMEKALKISGGQGGELQERFDCLVKAGLSEEDVVAIVKGAPQILSQSKEVLEIKIRYLVNDLGYPVSSLKPFPYYLNYSMKRVKLRCAMCKWLVDKSAIKPTLALRTIIAYTESDFVKKFVEKHPQGLEVWQELKNRFSV